MVFAKMSKVILLKGSLSCIITNNNQIRLQTFFERRFKYQVAISKTHLQIIHKREFKLI